MDKEEATRQYPPSDGWLYENGISYRTTYFESYFCPICDIAYLTHNIGEALLHLDIHYKWSYEYEKEWEETHG